ATKGGGHGYYHCVVLAHSSVQEAYDLVFLGFELSDRYRTPTIILSDGMLGQMMEPLLVARRSSLVSGNKKIVKKWALTGCKGRSPNLVKSFFMQEGELEEHNKLLQKNYEQIKRKEQRFQGLHLEDADIILVAYGSQARIARSVMMLLRKKGKKVGLLRPISLWPFPKNIFESLLKKKRRSLRFFVIEMSYGQMVEDVRLTVNGRAPVEFYGRAGGGIPTEEEIIKKINRFAH
ncbi:MAG: 3-methyl-2-oxobutanoate dehydrogenase subunit beta, partial [Omnitrophica bacterium]|nr:3-methyl-2-oxobutanoate dehydrogenase subunit beta [Candidatus Omnitrophota bacterium]